VKSSVQTMGQQGSKGPWFNSKLETLGYRLKNQKGCKRGRVLRKTLTSSYQPGERRKLPVVSGQNFAPAY